MAFRAVRDASGGFIEDASAESRPAAIPPMQSGRRFSVVAKSLWGDCEMRDILKAVDGARMSAAQKERRSLVARNGVRALKFLLVMCEAMVRRVDSRGALLVGIALFLTGCSMFGVSETPAGPGVPRIANLRFEPETVAIGQPARMSFYFEVGSADLDTGYVLDQGIAQFQFYTALQPIIVDLKQYSGLVAGTAEVQLRWPTEGFRWVEFYVVTLKGNASNRLRAPLTVR